ncbi:MAG TPA: hypothetical protein VHX13_07575 [Acidobacteriaceae bacterium]|jgi:hypothetical protein|nr:hypothetical protein [Acidobacteriaceae bacterium]
MTYADILTPRLRLVAITPALLRVEGPALAAAAGGEIPTTWPPEHWEPHVYDFLEALYARAPYAIAWTRYVVTRAEPETLIERWVDFRGRRQRRKSVMAFCRPGRGRAWRPKRLLALMDEIRRREEVQTFTAQTYPQLAASVRVLEKCGFRLAGPGDEEGTVRYRRKR